MLRQCVQSLLAQQHDSALLRWRLVVVENDAVGAARSIFESLCPAPSQHRFVQEPKLGIPFARNLAIETALDMDADLIAFIDDDEIAPLDWLQTLYEALVGCDADVVQGGVRQLSQGAAAEMFPDFSARKHAKLRQAETAATCNTLMRSWLAREPHMLRFDESMRFTGGSDLEFFMRASQAGATIMRAPGIVLLEERVAERETYKYRARRSFAAGGNYHARITKNCGPLTALRRIVFRALGNALSGLARLLVGLVRWPLAPRAGRRSIESGLVSLHFAAGCWAAALGARAQPYLHVQGI